jgi:RNA polymerase sigma-70 factor (ECF subfamily)
MLGNEADALDATQDALVAAIRALGRFDGRSSFGTWIYRIATNTCIDEMRRRRRRPVTGVAADIGETADEVSFGAPGLFIVPAARGGALDAGAEGEGPTADEGAFGSARFDGDGRRPGVAARRFGGGGGSPDPADIVAARVDVDVALALLPVEFRTAIVLRDVCDLPYDEIAGVLGVPVGTVRSRIARARSALAATLQTEAPEPRGRPGDGRPAGNFPAPSGVKTPESDRSRAKSGSDSSQKDQKDQKDQKEEHTT